MFLKKKKRVGSKIVRKKVNKGYHVVEITSFFNTFVSLNMWECVCQSAVFGTKCFFFIALIPKQLGRD